MPEWVIALICVAIVIVAILITSLVKVIMKKVAEKDGGTFDAKKWEYLYGAISLLVSAAGVYYFLTFVVKMTDVNEIIKTTALYAGSVQTIYLFIVQLIRKGGIGLFGLIVKLFTKLKTSKDPVKELPEIIEDEVEEEPVEEVKAEEIAPAETEVQDDEMNKISDEFIKIITGKTGK
jgi:hypothetical protein